VPNADADVALVGLWPRAPPLEPLTDAPRLGPEVREERRDGNDAVVLGRNANIEAKLGVVADDVGVPAEGADGRTGVGKPSGVAAAGWLVRFGALGSVGGEGVGLTRATVGAGDAEPTPGKAGSRSGGGVMLGRNGSGASTGGGGGVS
jgi:hypothetical protein